MLEKNIQFKSIKVNLRLSLWNISAVQSNHFSVYTQMIFKSTLINYFANHTYAICR